MSSYTYSIPQNAVTKLEWMIYVSESVPREQYKYNYTKCTHLGKDKLHAVAYVLDSFCSILARHYRRHLLWLTEFCPKKCILGAIESKLRKNWGKTLIQRDSIHQPYNNLKELSCSTERVKNMWSLDRFRFIAMIVKHLKWNIPNKNLSVYEAACIQTSKPPKQPFDDILFSILNVSSETFVEPSYGNCLSQHPFYCLI